MFPRCQFRHDTAKGLMGRELRSDDIRDHLLARAHHGCGSLVAGTLDAEDVGVRHVFSLSFSAAIDCSALIDRPIIVGVSGIMGLDSLLTAMLKDFATSIVQTLRQRGFQAYLV